MSYYKGKRNVEKSRNTKLILKYAKKLKLIKEFKGCNICNIFDMDRPWIYQFHHLDPKEKDYEIGKLLTLSYARIKEEIKKCICVCENCHRKLHDNTNKKSNSNINKILLLEEKGETCCTSCGYNDCLKSLDFHHIEEKETNISDFTNKSHEFISENIIEIRNELNKCIVLCANCHRDVHANMVWFEENKHEILKKMNNIKTSNKPQIDHDDILYLKEKGLTQKEISLELGCAISTVCEVLKMNNIHTFKEKPVLDVDLILKLRSEGKTNVEISKILNCHRFSIPHALKRHKERRNK